MKKHYQINFKKVLTFEENDFVCFSWSKYNSQRTF